jgi:hypothetical protein
MTDLITDQNKTSRLFWLCFIAMAATAFAFGIRNLIIGDLGPFLGFPKPKKGRFYFKLSQSG